MPIGTSLGNQYNNLFDLHAKKYQPVEDVLSPGMNQMKDDIERSADEFSERTQIKSSTEPQAIKASADYDYEGWQAANPGVRMSPGQHYPDTFKLPNHITFSNESKYSNDDTQGGIWQKGDNNTWSFTPSAYNFTQHSPAELKEYFSKYEPGNTLNLDTAQGMAAEATEKAQDALKRAQGTLPSLDSDVGLRGSVVAGTPDYLRKAGIDTTITSGDVDQAIDIGMATSGGGLTFGGVKSATLASSPEMKAALYKAQDLKLAGKDSESIWAKTGFYEGSDGKWRYEIPDQNSKLNPNLLKQGVDADKNLMYVLPQSSIFSNTPLRLGDILDHPELYKAYPELQSTRVMPMPDHINASGMAGRNGVLYLSPNTPDKMHSTILHEVQHFIQDKEGFSNGGSSNMFLPKELPKMQSELFKKADVVRNRILDKGLSEDQFTNLVKAANQHIQGTANSEVRDIVENSLKSNKDFKEVYDVAQGLQALKDLHTMAFEKYEAMPGEMEARNVELRKSFSDLARKLNSPESTQTASTIPREKRILNLPNK